MTIGDYVEMILSDKGYYSTVFPRIPTIPQQEIQKHLAEVPARRERKKLN